VEDAQRRKTLVIVMYRSLVQRNGERAVKALASEGWLRPEEVEAAFGTTTLETGTLMQAEVEEVE
jgi:hypothetical protein